VKQIISKIGLRDPHRSPILHGIGQFPNLGADNARTENVWRWFMRNPEITKAMELIGLRQMRFHSPQPLGWGAGFGSGERNHFNGFENAAHICQCAFVFAF
jgi:hypothetical protein